MHPRSNSLVGLAIATGLLIMDSGVAATFHSTIPPFV